MPLEDSLDRTEANERPWLNKLEAALDLFDRPGFVTLMLLPVFLQWLVPSLRSRFWLDEAVTWWTTDRGFAELLRRCTHWPGSILYNGIILGLRTLGIHQEWMLRLPSLVAAALAAALLFDLARRWFSRRVAIAAVAIFCSQQWVSFAAADARPYALGILMVVTSTWLMLRWLETERAEYAAGSGLTAALIVHFHMLFATVLVFQSIFLVLVMKRNSRTFRQAAAGLGIFASLAVLLAPQYLNAFHDRKVHTFATVHGLSELGVQFLPTLPMLASVLLAAFLPRLKPIKRSPVARNSVLLALLWAIVPMSLMYGASVLTGSDLFVGRYVVPSVPGLALCFGIVLEYLSPRLRTGVVLLIFLMPRAIDCARGEFASHTWSGDWAAAIQRVDRENVRTQLPAFMRSPFPESDYWDWRGVQIRDSALYAPLAYYSSLTEWHPLPATFTPEAGRAIDILLRDNTRAREQGFFLTELATEGPADSWVAYLRGKMKPGDELREIGIFEGVRVLLLRWGQPRVAAPQSTVP